MKKPAKKRAAAAEPEIDDKMAEAARETFNRLVNEAPPPLWFWWWNEMPEGAGKKRFGKLLFDRPKRQSDAKWAENVRAHILGSRKLCEIIFENLFEAAEETKKTAKRRRPRTRKPPRQDPRGVVVR
jgi:hypothetical protein